VGLPLESLGKPLVGLLSGITLRSQFGLNRLECLFNPQLVRLETPCGLFPRNMLVPQVGLKVSNRLLSGG
jgi:hypothetical protein